MQMFYAVFTGDRISPDIILKKKKKKLLVLVYLCAVHLSPPLEPNRAMTLDQQISTISVFLCPICHGKASSSSNRRK